MRRFADLIKVITALRRTRWNYIRTRTGCVSTIWFLIYLITQTDSCAQGLNFKRGNDEYLEIRISAPIGDREYKLLSEIVEPEKTSEALAAIEQAKIPVELLCQRATCFAQQTAVANAARIARARGGSGDFSFTTLDTKERRVLPGTAPPRWFDDFRPYAVFDGTDPIAEAVNSGDAGTFAVPESAIRPIIDASKGNSPVSVIQADLDRAGISERTARINRLLSTEDVARRLNLLRSTPNITINTTPRPRNTFTPVQFLAAATSCSMAEPHWPYDVPEVHNILNFNKTILEKMGLGVQERARILVVDTGIGKQLALSKLAKALYINQSEILLNPTRKAQFSGPILCNDADNNSYWRDVYGSTAGQSQNDEECKKLGFDDFSLIAPFLPATGISEEYKPSHGSFVSVMAAGGPEAIERIKNLSSFIGLTTFRITRKDPGSDTILLERSSIRESLEYAESIDADVINMSLKTDDEHPFHDFRERGRALLVVAAGNFAEDLDQFAFENRPASMVDLTDRMIVVSALQNTPELDLWPSSARSKSKVNIAAPGKDIRSWDIDGREICESGTSAAAPLVSFTAAIVRALTQSPRSIVRSRILASADHNPKLDATVEDGRVLNIAAAVDVFVDRVELLDGKVKRGWIAPESEGHLFSVCTEDSAALIAHRGQIDLGLLWEWWRIRPNAASIGHQLEKGRYRRADNCTPAEGGFLFFNVNGRQLERISWANVKKLLPTPFRGVKKFVID